MYVCVCVCVVCVCGCSNDQLVYVGSLQVIKREEFEARKMAAAASKLTRREQKK